MLTDTFFVRYESFPVFGTFLEREKKLLFQVFTIVEEIRPFWSNTETKRKRDGTFWESLHKKLSNELGIRWLSNPGPDPIIGKWEYKVDAYRTREWIEICRKWMLEIPAEGCDIDKFIKERISLVEIGLREVFEYSKFSGLSGKLDTFTRTILAESRKEARIEHDVAAAELNIRLSTARVLLDYHNGFLQITADEITSREIEKPFWSVVSGSVWLNVDLDMKEALDQRDSGGKDPALYASRALESKIKIISDATGVTTGKEKGAVNYIENLAKGASSFLVDWEADLLRSYFSKVRNPLNHGSGSLPIPTLRTEQTAWAIESAMSWIKMLICRLSATGNQATP